MDNKVPPAGGSTDRTPDGSLLSAQQKEIMLEEHAKHAAAECYLKIAGLTRPAKEEIETILHRRMLLFALSLESRYRPALDLWQACQELEPRPINVWKNAAGGWSATADPGVYISDGLHGSMAKALINLAKALQNSTAIHALLERRRLERSADQEAAKAAGLEIIAKINESLEESARAKRPASGILDELAKLEQEEPDASH